MSTLKFDPAKTIPELSDNLKDHHQYLSKIDGDPLPTTGWIKQQLAPVNKLVADLKAQQDKVAEEVVKPTWEQVLEKLGLGPVAEIIKKGIEGGIGAAIVAGIVALGGIIVPLLMIALGALLVFKLQKWHSGRNANNETIGMRPDGSFGRRNFTDIQNERNGVAAGGIADLPANANFDALRNQLTLLNPELLKFNNRAPDFKSNMRKMPSPGKAQKAADAVKKVADAIGQINAATLATVAGNISKIVDRMGKADPLHIGKVAKAVGELVTAAKDLKPEMIPQARRVQDSATAVGNLATATGTLRTKFVELRGTVQSLDQELGGATT
ncbi:hypothetical protein [Streptomyces sp. NPDC093795]|uniref:hypothetical protein n=1 Tax=Streptomyces sp. NPDC093795 TaxID=3366051 RepID=UPI003822A838